TNQVRRRLYRRRPHQVLVALASQRRRNCALPRRCIGSLHPTVWPLEERRIQALYPHRPPVNRCYGGSHGVYTILHRGYRHATPLAGRAI
ncbi:unnamed protein product, partial [Aphanomyces euteiches]